MPRRYNASGLRKAVTKAVSTDDDGLDISPFMPARTVLIILNISN